MLSRVDVPQLVLEELFDRLHRHLAPPVSDVWSSIDRRRRCKGQTRRRTRDLLTWSHPVATVTREASRAGGAARGSGYAPNRVGCSARSQVRTSPYRR